MTYILKSVKAIEFYNKNPSIDFNNMNELFIDFFQKMTSTVQSSISINEVKALLNTINNKVDNIDNSLQHNNQMVKMTYESTTQQKDYYVEQIKSIFNNNQQNNDILTLIRETNQNFVDKTIYSILQQFPKLNETLTKDLKQIINEQQNSLIHETQRSFQQLVSSSNQIDPNTIEKTIQDNYINISDKVSSTLFSFFNENTQFQQNTTHIQNIQQNLQNFLEIQKNSTLKGKESEEKLEACLIKAFPYAAIHNKSGESKSCDYLLERKDKPNIMFENKDYSNNVPNEEIKKFIRDVEYQKSHAILLSQHSGVNHKEDFQIDIHAGNILVYIHFVNYDTSKIRIGVNLIDHLDKIISNNNKNQNSAQINMEDFSLVNKEYLNFIGQKKQMIETYKKFYKDHLKQLEDFDMPYLTSLLDKSFTNVEQLSYKCEFCGTYNAKNKRALVTHQNKCKKNFINNNNTIDSSSNNVIDLNP